MSSGRHSEAAFETVIEAHLLQNGYVPVARHGFKCYWRTLHLAFFKARTLPYRPARPSPDFLDTIYAMQRRYVWRSTRVRDLLDSPYRWRRD